MYAWVDMNVRVYKGAPRMRICLNGYPCDRIEQVTILTLVSLNLEVVFASITVII